MPATNRSPIRVYTDFTTVADLTPSKVPSREYQKYLQQDTTLSLQRRHSSQSDEDPFLHTETRDNTTIPGIRRLPVVPPFTKSHEDGDKGTAHPGNSAEVERAGNPASSSTSAPAPAAPHYFRIQDSYLNALDRAQLETVCCKLEKLTALCDALDKDLKLQMQAFVGRFAEEKAVIERKSTLIAHQVDTMKASMVALTITAECTGLQSGIRASRRRLNEVKAETELLTAEQGYQKRKNAWQQEQIDRKEKADKELARQYAEDPMKRWRDLCTAETLLPYVNGTLIAVAVVLPSILLAQARHAVHPFL